MYKLGHNNNNK